MAINLNRFDLISLRLLVSVVDLGSLTLGAKEFGIIDKVMDKRPGDPEPIKE